MMNALTYTFTKHVQQYFNNYNNTYIHYPIW